MMSLDNTKVCEFLNDDERKLYKSYKRILFWKNFWIWGTFAVFLIGAMTIGLALVMKLPAAVWWVALPAFLAFQWHLERDRRKLQRFCNTLENRAEAREARKLGIL